MSIFSCLYLPLVYILYNFSYHLPFFFHKLCLFHFFFMNKTLKHCPVHRNHSINLGCLKTLILGPHSTMSELIGLGLGLRSNISSKSFGSADEEGQCKDETENKFSRKGQSASLQFQAICRLGESSRAKVSSGSLLSVCSEPSRLRGLGKKGLSPRTSTAKEPCEGSRH